jgi:ABC-2 type transport system permease protein
MMLPTWTLLRREMVRFFRQRSRVLSVVATPLLLWFLVGSGLGASFRPSGAPDGVGSLEFLFPGMLMLVVLFTAIFSTISIIEDRREGFLQSVLVAPVPRSAVVLGKMLGGTALALVQVVPMLVLAPLVGLQLGAAGAGLATLVLAVVAFGLSGLGFLMAWRLDSVQGFHAVMNVFLMPLWMLSGAFFPASGAPGWLQAAMAVNPMTYALAALRRALYLGGRQAGDAGVPGLQISLAVAAGFAIVMFAAAVRQARRTTRADLQ